MQDATAQMALLQFMLSGRDATAVPTTVHCDHLIRARVGRRRGPRGRAIDENREVYDFLQSASARYGIGFWKPGAGIIHQVVLENYAFPGGMMIGTDSHTPNAGGLGMFAVGVGGADAVDVMAGFPWEVTAARSSSASSLTGKLHGWTAPKDVILKLPASSPSRAAPTGSSSTSAPAPPSISCTGKAHDHQHGRRARRDDLDLPLRRAAWRPTCAPPAAAELADLADGQPRPADAPTPRSRRTRSGTTTRSSRSTSSTLEPHLVGPHTPGPGPTGLRRWPADVAAQRLPATSSRRR